MLYQLGSGSKGTWRLPPHASALKGCPRKHPPSRCPDASMADKTGEKQRRRDGGRPFRPGESGNPNGRPAGARNRVSALALKLMDADAEPVIVALIQAAKGGDVAAIKLVLERVAPLPRNRPVHVRHAGNRNRR